MITGAVYEFNMQSTNTAKGDLVSYDASERQLVYYIDKKIIIPIGTKAEINTNEKIKIKLVEKCVDKGK